MGKSIFKEKQSYHDTVVFAILWVGIGAMIYGVIDSLLSTPPQYYHAAFFGIVGLGLGLRWWWLKKLKLKVAVTKRNIKYRMFPLHQKSRKIPWDEVESCQVYKTPPAARWHGGNMHYANEKWFSLTGRNGLAIETKDGHHYFIGCEDVDRLADSIESRSPGE
jgi:hypothetical protein